jgi:NTP pyrophosphatase (non-canonical NTP hydrolase)
VTLWDAQQDVAVFYRAKLPEGITAKVQFLKLVEEVGELADGLLKEDGRLTADALGDCLYVLLGIANLSGVDLETTFQKIHFSNMTKTKTGSVNPGKLAGYQEPKL